MTQDLVDRFGALLFDLDGVVYIGPSAVPHAAEAIAASRARGVSCVFVTNNASRSPQAVAEHLTELGVAALAADVVTSPQAAASLLAAYVPVGAPVLVIGGQGISEALAERGYVPVGSLSDGPAAVVQGYSPDLSWRDLAEATYAVRTGLPWIATNADLTIPTPRGVAPGNGALVDIVARTVGRPPDAIAGKPEPPLLREAIARSGAVRPLMIGDRLDTDISAGSRVDIPTLLVFTGVTSILELLEAVPHERPDFLAYDLRSLLSPYPDVVLEAAAARCGRARARLQDGVLIVEQGPDAWDAVRAAAALAWAAHDAGMAVALDPAAQQLTTAALSGPA